MFHSRMLHAVTIVACSAVLPRVRWPARRTSQSARPVRYGSVIGLRAEKLEEYKKLHAAVWPKVVAAVREANIRNFSIYLRKLPDGKYYLFSYMEYVGDDFAGGYETPGARIPKSNAGGR